MNTAPSPGVLIYRRDVLPYSETFIVSQAASLERYRPLITGRNRVAQADLRGLPVATASPNPPASFALRRTLLRARFSKRQLAELRAHGPTLLHAHFGPDALVGERVASALGIPFMTTFHGFDVTRSTAPALDMRRWVYGQRIPGLVQRGALTLAVSDHVRAALVARGADPARIRTHYIGIDTTRFSPDPARREPGLVVAVGRLVEKKGFADLIDAFARLQPSIPGARLVIIGDGALRGALEARAAGVRGVELPGTASADEVRSWMGRASVVAVPSVTGADGETEGLPIVLLEAMASGVPVVGTRHAGIPEAIEDGVSGALVPERAPEALAAALKALLGDPARAAAVGAAARERAKATFDLARQTQLLERHYDAVARGA